MVGGTRPYGHYFERTSRLFVGLGRVFEIVYLGRLWLVEPAPTGIILNVHLDCLWGWGGFLRLSIWGRLWLVEPAPTGIIYAISIAQSSQI
jgi:hypothetical protein